VTVRTTTVVVVVGAVVVVVARDVEEVGSFATVVVTDAGVGAVTDGVVEAGSATTAEFPVVAVHAARRRLQVTNRTVKRCTATLFLWYQGNSRERWRPEPNVGDWNRTPEARAHFGGVLSRGASLKRH
jgi:hypothetical protein